MINRMCNMIGQDILNFDKHFTKEKIDAGVLSLSYLPADDMLTKDLSKRQFDKLINKLAMEDIYKAA